MSKFKQPLAEEKQESFSNKCKMTGCPLVGTMSDNVRGGGPWWCSYHFNGHDGFGLMPEEITQLSKIASQYNSGRRNYGAGILETREEMHVRLRESGQTKGTRPDSRD